MGGRGGVDGEGEGEGRGRDGEGEGREGEGWGGRGGGDTPSGGSISCDSFIVTPQQVMESVLVRVFEEGYELDRLPLHIGTHGGHSKG